MPSSGRPSETTHPAFPTVSDLVGRTPMVRLQRMAEGVGRGNTLLLKLEGQNPAGSVKDRPAFSMLREAQARGEIRPGDTLIEATSGNTGIALAMAAAVLGYRMILIMPEGATPERKAAMRAYGAELVLVSDAESMEGARDLALRMEAEGKGRVLNQFANPDNPAGHYRTTGPEIWEQTDGRVTHFVSSMGTTGTIMGVSRALKERNPAVRIIGLQPAEGSRISGIRRWPPAYLPAFFEPHRVDQILEVDQAEAEETMRRLAREEGVFAGVSSGGAVAGALRVAEGVEDAVIVAIVCDRGDRYLSSGVFEPREEAPARPPPPR